MESKRNKRDSKEARQEEAGTADAETGADLQSEQGASSSNPTVVAGSDRSSDPPHPSAQLEIPNKFPTALRHLKRQTSRPQTVVTNSFSATITDKKIYRYDVSVMRKQEGKVAKEVAGTAGGSRKKQQCFSQLIRKALEWHNSKRKHAIVYDGAKTLYSPSPLILKETNYEVKDTELEPNLKKEFFQKQNGTLTVLFVNSENGTLYTSNIKNETLKNMVSGDKRITGMYQLVLTQKARDEGFLISDGGKEMFSLKETAHRDGIILRTGIGASIRVADGEGGKGEVQVLINYKQAKFFAPTGLKELDVLKRYRSKSHAEVAEYLRGIRVGVIYSRRTFVIQNITNIPIGEMTASNGEPLMDVVKEARREADKDAEDIPIDKHLPAVIIRVYDSTAKVHKDFYFAVEHLVMTGDQKLLQKHKDIPPPPETSTRCNETRRLAVASYLMGQNQIFADFGLKINENPIKCTGYSIEAPRVEYFDKKEAELNARKQWTYGKNKFSSVGGDIPELLILYNSRTDGNISRAAYNLKEKFKDFARGIGMKFTSIEIEDLKDLPVRRGTSSEMACEAIVAKTKDIEKQYKKNGKERPYCIYIDKSNQDTHDTIKLQERLTGITIQQACVDKVLGHGFGPISARNLLAKVNFKNGGQNHNVVTDESIQHLWGGKARTLVFSYDVCHASGRRVFKKNEESDEPACVGFGFNITRNQQVFVGDFNYQDPRKESVDADILHARARQAWMTYTENNHRAPQTVIIIRDGVSEGQFAMVLQEEFRAIKWAMVNAAEEKEERVPSFAVLVVTKRNAHRIYIESRGNGFRNVPPLTAVDSNVVRKDANEVIFVAHHPLRGTCKPQLLNLLLNENVFDSNREMLQFVASLCALHQAHTGFVSLPETICAADEYAERGSKLYNIYLRRRNTIPMVNNKPDYKKLTKLLSYEDTRWREIHIP